MTIEPPTDAILRSFGEAGAVARAVPGGQGVTFHAGPLAIKRCDDIEQTEWLFGVLEGVVEQGFRIARPVRAATGHFVAEGWCATRWIEGTTAIEGRWVEAIAALDAFHHALRLAPLSPLLARAENPYARADAAIWADVRSKAYIWARRRSGYGSYCGR